MHKINMHHNVMYLNMQALEPIWAQFDHEQRIQFATLQLTGDGKNLS